MADDQNMGQDVQQALAQSPGGPPSMMNMGAIPPTNPVQASVNPQAGPMPTQMGGGPIGIGGGVDTMQPGTQVGQQGSSPQDYANLVQQVMRLPQMAGPMGSLSDIQKQEHDIQLQQQGLTPPKYGPQVEKGKSFLHNLGQVLLLAASATGPGAAVEKAVYRPGIQQYQAKQGALASQLATLKQQEDVPTEQLRATTGAAQGAGMYAYRQGQLGINKERVDAYSQMVQGRLQKETADIAAKIRGLDQKDQQLAMTQWYQQQEAALRDKAINMGMKENDARIASNQAIVNVLTDNGMIKEYPWLSTLTNMGVLPQGVVPSPAQAPGGAQPVQGNQPLPKRNQPQQARPGYKLQKNTRTGEVREVPIAK